MRLLTDVNLLDLINAYAEQIQLIGEKEISRVYLNSYFVVDSIELIMDDDKKECETMLFQINCRFGNQTDDHKILFNVSKTIDIPVDKINSYDYVSGVIYHMAYIEELEDER